MEKTTTITATKYNKYIKRFQKESYHDKYEISPVHYTYPNPSMLFLRQLLLCLRWKMSNLLKKGSIHKTQIRGPSTHTHTHHIKFVYFLIIQTWIYFSLLRLYIIAVLVIERKEGVLQLQVLPGDDDFSDNLLSFIRDLVW